MTLGTNGTGPSVIIRGIGVYAPERIMTNAEISEIVDTSDEWIRARTGIRERRIAAEGEQTSDMAVVAARRAMDDAGVGADEIDLLIVATMTPEMMFPATACLTQTKLGLPPIAAFDVSAACSGFIYGLEVGSRLLKAGAYRNALIIGAEKFSSILDWQDRTTCVLFGDGAGAVVLSKTDEPDVGVIGTHMAANGSEAKILNMPAGGSALPPSSQTIDARMHFLKMAGREVFKHAVKVMGQSAADILASHQLTPGDITCVIPHQANMRIIDSIATRMNLPLDRFLINVDRYGNTSAASIPLALEEARRTQRFSRGDYLLLVAFGAGLTWGSSLIKWH